MAWHLLRFGLSTYGVPTLIRQSDVVPRRGLDHRPNGRRHLFIVDPTVLSMSCTLPLLLPSSSPEVLIPLGDVSTGPHSGRIVFRCFAIGLVLQGWK